MSTQATIHSRLLAVMADVGAVRKSDRNSSQNFNFRGIDAVVNAVYPAFIKHGVFVTPCVIESTYEQVAIGRQATLMGHVRVKVQFTFHAEDTSSVQSTVVAEAMDAGDKAHAKAMSVALRTALLQTLCLPTDEPDPDADSYERTSHESAPRVVSSRRPEQVSTKEAATGRAGLTKAQQAWIGKQTLDDMTKVSDILGRVVGSLADVNADEARILIQRLAKQEND